MNTTSWKQVNKRRGYLIEKKAAAPLSLAEETELAQLQAFADEYIRVHAPLPIKHLEKIRAQLQRKGQWEGKE